MPDLKQKWGKNLQGYSDMVSVAHVKPEGDPVLQDKLRLLEQMVYALVEENKRLSRLLEASPTFCPTCGKK